MVTVETVRTKKQQREFLNLPLDLYKGNPYYVPPMWMDEKKIFARNYVYNTSCDSEFFLAYKDGKPAGRIQGKNIIFCKQRTVILGKKGIEAHIHSVQDLCTGSGISDGPKPRTDHGNHDTKH